MKVILSTVTLLSLAAGSACEYRDEVSALSINRDCHVLARGHSITVQGQARNVSGDGVNGAGVTWSITPALLTLDSTSAKTAHSEVDGIASDGLCAAKVTYPMEAEIALPFTATLQAALAVDDTLISDTTEIRLSDGSDGVTCPDEEVSAAADASVDTM